MSKIKDQVSEILQTAIKECGFPEREIILDIPKDEKFGDASSNVAMTLSKELKTPPRKIAEEIISKINIDNKLITKTQIAGARKTALSWKSCC